MLNPQVADRPAPIPQAVTELWELVVAYFKQETTEPLKGLARVIGFGILGSLLLGAGVIFIAVGVLRLLQHEGPNTFDGNLSVLPYVIVIVGLLVTAGLVFKLGTRTKRDKPKPPAPAPIASPNPFATPTPTSAAAAMPSTTKDPVL